MGQKVTGNRELGMASGILLFLILVLFDQATKLLAILGLKDTEGISLIPGVFRLQYLENRGAAFGILQNRRWFFIILTTAFLIAVVYIWIRMPNKRTFRALRILCVLVSAGAIGNLIDRAALVYVRDFIYFVLIDFPIFNIADIYVTVSAFLMFILVLFYYKEEDFSFLNPKAGEEHSKIEKRADDEQ